MTELSYNYEEPYEILNGKIFYMTPRPSTDHNKVIRNLIIIIGNYLKGKDCQLFSDGVDVFLDDDNNVIPDLMIVCNTNIIKKKGIYGAPDLVVEVLSPSTTANDRGYKKELYEKHEIKEYWIVDTNNKSIDAYLLKNKKYVLDNVYSIYPNYLLEKMKEEEIKKIKTEFKISLFDDLTIDLQSVFANIE